MFANTLTGHPSTTDFGMRWSNWHKEASWREQSAYLGRWALLLAFAALPIKGELVPLPLVVGIVLLLPQVAGFGKLKDKALLLLPVAFYLLHVLGMAWTTDVDFGSFDLEVKLGLMIVPLIGAGLVADKGKDLLRPAMVAFSCGMLVAMVICFWSGIACYLETGWRECFSQSYVSPYLHPGYLAWYACWALFYWGRELIDGQVEWKRWPWVCGILMMLPFAFVVMVASKSGWLGLLLVLATLLIHAARTLPGRMMRLLIMATLLVAVLSGTLASRMLMVRMSEAADAVEKLFRNDTSFLSVESSSDERLAAWNCSVDCLKLSPWGAGTGDIKHALMACYESNGATAAIQHRLNSHSQVLQSGVALGWAGLLLVVGMMLAPLAIGVMRKDAFMAIFAALFIINGTIESVLEVQAGVVFFILFYVVLVRRSSVHRPQPTAHP
jgi:hypothetical protein